MQQSAPLLMLDACFLSHQGWSHTTRRSPCPARRSFQSEQRPPTWCREVLGPRAAVGLLSRTDSAHAQGGGQLHGMQGMPPGLSTGAHQAYQLPLQPHGGQSSGQWNNYYPMYQGTPQGGLFMPPYSFVQPPHGGVAPSQQQQQQQQQQQKGSRALRITDPNSGAVVLPGKL